jgi:hypothetical protein
LIKYFCHFSYNRPADDFTWTFIHKAYNMAYMFSSKYKVSQSINLLCIVTNQSGIEVGRVEIQSLHISRDEFHPYIHMRFISRLDEEITESVLDKPLTFTIISTDSDQLT